jgi:hypothetical protein
MSDVFLERMTDAARASSSIVPGEAIGQARRIASTDEGWIPGGSKVLIRCGSSERIVRDVTREVNQAR